MFSRFIYVVVCTGISLFFMDECAYVPRFVDLFIRQWTLGFGEAFILLFSVSEAFKGGRHLSIYILPGREPLDEVVPEQMDGARP